MSDYEIEDCHNCGGEAWYISLNSEGEGEKARCPFCDGTGRVRVDGSAGITPDSPEE